MQAHRRTGRRCARDAPEPRSRAKSAPPPGPGENRSRPTAGRASARAARRKAPRAHRKGAARAAAAIPPAAPRVSSQHPSFRLTLARLDDFHARRCGQLHVQRLARDLLDACRHSPCRLLERKLSEFDIELARPRFFALELDEKTPRLMS